MGFFCQFSNCRLNLHPNQRLIISSWQELVSRGQIVVYGFVIMPNHLHVIWKLKEPNGKESPHASFNKYTSHMILKDLKQNHAAVLPFFKVTDQEREYRIWQHDALAVLIDSKQKVEQKIDYIHRISTT